MQVQGVAVVQRQRRSPAPGLDHDSLEEFGDPVGRHVGRECKVGSDRDGGVGPVHRRLVQSPPDPPVRRTGSEEGPYRRFHARQLDGVEKPLRSAVQPGDRVGSVGRRFARFDAARKSRSLVESIAHDLRRPAIATADMAKQLLESSSRAARHRRCAVGVMEKLRESAVFGREMRPGNPRRQATRQDLGPPRSAAGTLATRPASSGRHRGSCGRRRRPASAPDRPSRPGRVQ